ncbi:MAG: circadian clock KaiB family protein [bacterium]
MNQQPLRAKPLETITKFQLYVLGDSEPARRSIDNLTRFCKKYYGSHFELKIVDLEQDPARATEDRIIAVPTLIRLEPLPVKRIFGDFLRTDQLLLGLGLPMNSVNEPNRCDETGGELEQ